MNRKSFVSEAEKKPEETPVVPLPELLRMADGTPVETAEQWTMRRKEILSLFETRVYGKLPDAAEEKVFFTIKNISANPLNISPEELTERFVRGDVSRTTEGSGLGLSIAQSLTELQQGIFKIEIDGDYFKASVGFDILKPEAQVMAEDAAADSTAPDSTGF